MNGTPEQRKLAAIMFTDMVGYSALSQRDDKLALELLEEHRQLLREIFPRFHGTEIKTIGDAFLVEFNSALEAAQCAIEIQRALAKRNADAAADHQIQVRIGIHIGDVVHRASDVYGDGVNIASRIEQLANAGGICVSMDVERQIHNALEARLEKLAPTELKNISVPMDLFRIALPWERHTKDEGGRKKEETARSANTKWIWISAAAGLLIAALLGYKLGPGGVRSPMEGGAPATPGSVNSTQAGLAGARPSIPDKGIAVLPFENLSSDKENAYFADGIQEEILTRLSKIADLKVISRTSTQHFKSAPENLPEIAKQLGVAHVLEGSVQKAAEQLRVNVQLINAATDSHLWAEGYDRKLNDIFAVESEIATRIAESLQAKLTGAEQRALALRPTENSEAHDLYLRGMYYAKKYTPDAVTKAKEYLNKAIALDPNYALAYDGLAYVYYAGDWAQPPKVAAAKGRELAGKALQIDSSLAEPHASMGVIHTWYDYDWVTAEAEFKRALELNPNSVFAHQWYGFLLLASQRFDESIMEGRRAVELDPLSPEADATLGIYLVCARRYDEAVNQLRSTIELEPNYWLAHEYLARSLLQKGDVPAAVTMLEKTTHIEGAAPEVWASLGYAYAVAGNHERARKLISDLEKHPGYGYLFPYHFAVVYAGLGEKDKAFEFLDKEYKERAYNLCYARSDPQLDSLRSDSRFAELLRRLHLGP